MTEIWNTILRKALRCVDEVYPDSEAQNLGEFPIAAFAVEAATWVARVVPTHALGKGQDIPLEGFTPNTDGSGTLPLPSDFLRLVSFRMKGWVRAVNSPIRDTDARYAQQYNKTLRGGEVFPVVALCDGDTKLEYYSSSLGKYAQVMDARYFPIPSDDADFPENLWDITAWKIAEMVLSSMNDVSSAQLASAKVTEHLQAL